MASFSGKQNIFSEYKEKQTSIEKERNEFTCKIELDKGIIYLIKSSILVLFVNLVE